MRMTFILQLVIYLIFTHLLYLIVNALPSVPQSRRCNLQPNLPTANQTLLKTHSLPPPKPWNDHICRFPEAYPSVYLTFSFGCTISRSATPAMLRYIEIDIQTEIAQGLAEEAIHHHNIVRREDLELEFHLLVDRGRRMDFRAALEVVQLLRRCGFERGYYDEMWGVIYDRLGRRCGEFGLAFRREIGVEGE